MEETIKITRKIKAKLFAEYLGQKCKHKVKMLHDGSLEDRGLCYIDTTIIDLCDDKSGDYSTQIILKPISDISDEHALKVSELFGGASHLSKESQISQVKQVLSSPNFWINVTNITGASWLKVFQYLQFEGYDLPHYLLDGKTLQEA